MSDAENLLLENYLHDLERAVSPIVDREERISFVAEARVHLEQSIRTERERGRAHLESTQIALAKYGSAGENADAFSASAFEYQGRTTLTKRFGRANLIAYGLMQMAEVLFFLVLQLDIFLPAESLYRIHFSPAQVRGVWPEPLPFPDMSLRFFVLIGYPLLAPIVCGWLIGRLVPVRAAHAVYRGLTPLILISFVMGALLLPVTEGLLFALFQVAFWLPVGCLTAHFSSKLARWWNCKAHDRASESLRHSYLTEK